jgi:hypothetical protein
VKPEMVDPNIIHSPNFTKKSKQIISQNNKTQAKQFYNEYFKKATITKPEGIPRNTKIQGFKKNLPKPETSPKTSTTMTYFVDLSTCENKGEIIIKSQTPIELNKEYTCTKLSSQDDSYDRSNSLQFKSRKKNTNHFLIPVVKTNLYDEESSLQQSFKSETYSSETDRDSRVRRLSDLRKEKKLSRQESSESKNSGDEGLMRLNDKLNSIKLTFRNNKEFNDNEK